MLPRSMPTALKAVLIVCVIVIVLCCGFLVSFRRHERIRWTWGRRSYTKRSGLLSREIYIDSGRSERFESDQARVGRVVIMRKESRDKPEVVLSRDSDAHYGASHNASDYDYSTEMPLVGNATSNFTTTLLSQNSKISDSKSNSAAASLVPSLTVVTGNHFVVYTGLKLNVTNEGKVLVIASSSTSKALKSILYVVDTHRIPYVTLNLSTKQSKVTMTRVDDGSCIVGRFGVIVFDSVVAYSRMSNLDMQLVTKYCQDFGVGKIIFALSVSPPAQSPSFRIEYKQTFGRVQLNVKSPILRIFRRLKSTILIPVDTVWSRMISRDQLYQPVLMGVKSRSYGVSQNVLALHDQGSSDGIQKVWLGGDPRVWVNWLLFLDSIFYLSKGSVHLPLERYIQVDIDDIFTGKSGIRLKHTDVDALIKTQAWLANRIPGFVFYLGYSGGFYQRGTSDENLGDRCLVGNASRFLWFDHMLTHTQPHLFTSVASLVKDMEKNRQFAVDHKIPIVPGYAVSPHHSGVYPVHLPLFEAWKKLYNVSVTSTEEYPSPVAKERRGFVFKDIMVLPRQTCTLYTTINRFSEYHNGGKGLRAIAEGGSVFQTIVANQFSVFMTHMSNYGSDRLANFLLKALVEFVGKWTNIRLKAVSPLELARRYFESYPQDVEPLWKPPCANTRHKSIWSSKKSCKRLPNVLVVGPAKSGVHVLHKWLALHAHAQVKGNVSRLSVNSTDFFTRDYLKGLDWYMSHFEEPKLGHIVVDSVSGSSLSNVLVIKRITALLPEARVIFLVKNPIRLVQSLCKSEELTEFVTSAASTHKCLEESDYTMELQLWSKLYDRKQILIVDSDEFVSDPINVLNQVQTFLSLHKFDYSRILRLNSNLGYFCPSGSDGQLFCHSVHPRSEERLDSKTERLLYGKLKLQYNRLRWYLQQLKAPLPNWLAA